jgi:hypothetical protein
MPKIIKKGILALEKKFRQVNEEYIKNLEKTINDIKKSKFFQLWQAYCRIRDKILGRNEKNN